MTSAAVMIEALESERAGYVTHDRADRVAEVDKQIGVWRARLDAEQGAAVNLAAAGGQSLAQPDHVRKIVAIIGSLRDERAGYASTGKDDRVGEVDDQLEYWEAQLGKDGIVIDDVENTAQDLTGVETATVKTSPASRPAKRTASRPPAKK